MSIPGIQQCPASRTTPVDGGPEQSSGAAVSSAPEPNAADARDAAVAQTDSARVRTPARTRSVCSARTLPIRSDVPRPTRPGEVVVVTRSFHPDRTFGGGFDGDDRGFSGSPSATARIRAGVLLDTRGPCVRATEAGGRSDRTRHDVGHAVANTLLPLSGVFAPATATPTIHASSRPVATGTRVDLDYAGANPLIPGAPDIDVHSRFSLRVSDGGLEVRAVVQGDGFPAAESFLRDHEGNVVFIGVHQIDRESEPEGVARLSGDDGHPMMGVHLRILRDPETQAFTGVEAGGRRYSLAGWNARFTGLPVRRP